MERRRQFIKTMVAGGVAASAFPHLILGRESTNEYRTVETPHQDAAPVRIALIGSGSMGRNDVNSALRVPGISITAVCDLYDARLQRAKTEWGENLFTTRDYMEVLQRRDVDAVIVATSDHWHQKISIDAMNVGKHVYCEKPVIHKFSEAQDLIRAQERSGCVFLTGSQGMSSIGNRKAKQLVQNGAIGNVNLVEAAFTRAPRQGCRIPDGFSPSELWWDRYVMNNRRVAFEPSRFFCWRLWKDYGTGIAGDLFVHVLSSLQYIMDADGPERVYTTGDLDGLGDTPYIMLGYFDYPAKNGKKSFKAALTANYGDGVSNRWGSMDFMMIGDEGTLRVEWDKVTLRKPRAAAAADFSRLTPLGSTIDTPQQVSDTELLFAERGYNSCHVDHFTNFFNAIRNRTTVEGDVMFSVQTAVPAVMCFESYLTGRPVLWDAARLRARRG